jgi:hypothetical protein
LCFECGRVGNVRASDETRAATEERDMGPEV